jgi:soluble lytic murein transglycosylase
LLVAAVVHVESRFRRDAVSRAGARGLMQVMPATAEEVARDLGIDPFDTTTLDDPATNLRIGVRYLRRLLDEFGDVRYALAAYNGGPRAVRAWREAGGRRVADFPKGETRRYVVAVMRTWRAARTTAHVRSALRYPR